jgi:hypothetical protein
MFCLSLTKIKYLWYSEEFDCFLRGNSDVEKVFVFDVCLKNLGQLPK